MEDPLIRRQPTPLAPYKSKKVSHMNQGTPLKDTKPHQINNLKVI